MQKPPVTNPWVMAVVSWVIATCVVAGGYVGFMRWQGEPIRWDLLRDAALLVVPIALVVGWRDRIRRK